MALDKPTLKAGLIAIGAELYNNLGNLTPAEARERWAEELSTLIDAFVKSGDGIYQPGKLTAGANVVTAVGSPAIKIT